MIESIIRRGFKRSQRTTPELFLIEGDFYAARFRPDRNIDE
jgi:hypothetical protein